jgi:hypothetical protein
MKSGVWFDLTLKAMSRNYNRSHPIKTNIPVFHCSNIPFSLIYSIAWHLRPEPEDYVFDFEYNLS